MHEQRLYPRASGRLHLRYRRAPSPDASGWLDGQEPSADGRAPDPYMNFSEGGLAFDDVPECAEGDTLLLEVGVPGDDAPWRAVATVVRVSPIPIDERDDELPATHRLAVRFTTLPDEGRAAIRAYVDALRAGRPGRVG